MSHRYHPDEERNDPPDALLWDDCERCDEQAGKPLTLDEHKLAEAWAVMLTVELDRPGVSFRVPATGYRTRNERRLGRALYGVYVLVERVGGIDTRGQFGAVVPG